MKADFTNTDDFALADEGEQNTRVEKCYPQKSKENGRDMLVFELRSPNGAKLWHYCIMEAGKNWMLKKTIHAIAGHKPEKGPMEFDPEDFIGESLKVSVFHDEWQGRIKAKIKDVLLPGDDIPGSDQLPEEVPF